MAKQASQIRTNLYLSRRVWGLLKTRAFDERATASTLIDYVLRTYLKNRRKDLAHADLSIHRKHNGSEDRKPRAVYIDPVLWSQFQEQARVENVSAASLAESLLDEYLAGEGQEASIDPAGGSQAEQSNPVKQDPNRYVRVGDDVYDLGEKPIIIEIDHDRHQKDTKYDEE